MSHEIYTLAGGCFWCLDAALSQIRGVEDVECGYCGGTVEHPTYPQVCTGETGHAESVQIHFDPTVLNPDLLLDMFFSVHDPTTLNRQGADVGTQYRSAMFPQNPAQRARFLQARDRAAERFSAPVVTTITDGQRFFTAEPEHQDYFQKHPENRYCQLVVSAKAAGIRARYADFLK
ncbi:MAG: peptide-methionine (S)-S-oxide reductase MsrA [Microbacteriaceae bacterium]|jgi:peptide-methionine (S)-S-oxide reductase|nr:peptide-methionine (S)-S-oxide reductase MsrA [Microbacteriaceae bacterium]MCI1207474.1 peptide-methionine (S)-S-oxide reductase MsrA [Microbacteriaceae bacterium]